MSCLGLCGLGDLDTGMMAPGGYGGRMEGGEAARTCRRNGFSGLSSFMTLSSSLFFLQRICAINTLSVVQMTLWSLSVAVGWQVPWVPLGTGLRQ